MKLFTDATIYKKEKESNSIIIYENLFVSKIISKLGYFIDYSHFSEDNKSINEDLEVNIIYRN
jgi:hypothetical protein